MKILIENKEDFIIDVVKESTFQSQNKEYKEEYAKWRDKPDNPYGYKFVHDTREHSYVADEGYLNRKADVVEKIALYKCLGLLGIVLLVMMVIDIAHSLVMLSAYGEGYTSLIFFSDRNLDSVDVSLGYSIIAVLFEAAKFLVPAMIFKLVTKIPSKVAFPSSSHSNGLTLSSVLIMIVVTILGRMSSSLFSIFLQVFKLDSVYMYIYPSSDIRVMIISAISHCLIIPIVSEIFLRGVVLQTFRQFGDSFAIVVTCVISTFMYYDIANMGYILCSSTLIAIFTIRSGSLKTAIYMKICCDSLNYGLSMLSALNSYQSVIIEIIFSALIMGIGIIFYSRLTSVGKWNFNLPSDTSKITLAKKLKTMISTNTIAVWLAASIVFTFVCIRVI